MHNSVCSFDRHLQPIAACLIIASAICGCVSSDIDKPKLNAVVSGANDDSEAISRAQQQIAQQRSQGNQQAGAYSQPSVAANRNSEFEASQPAVYEQPLNESSTIEPAYLERFRSDIDNSSDQIRNVPYTVDQSSETTTSTASPSENTNSDNQTFSAEFRMELEVDLENTPVLEGPSLAGSIAGNDKSVRVLIKDSGGETVIKRPGDEIILNGQLYTISKTDVSYALLRASNGDHVVIK